MTTSLWLVAWGQLFRSDWQAVLVRGHDAEEATVIAREAFPDRLPPDHVLPAAEATARAVEAGEPDPLISRLPVIG